jgi:hypothetical protein
VRPYDLQHAATRGRGPIAIVRPDKPAIEARWLTRADETGHALPAACGTRRPLFPIALFCEGIKISYSARLDHKYKPPTHSIYKLHTSTNHFNLQLKSTTSRLKTTQPSVRLAPTAIETLANPHPGQSLLLYPTFTMPASVASTVSSIVKPSPVLGCGESCDCCGCDESCWCVVM